MTCPSSELPGLPGRYVAPSSPSSLSRRISGPGEAGSWHPLAQGSSRITFLVSFAPCAAKKKSPVCCPYWISQSLQAWPSWTAVGSGPWARVQVHASWTFPQGPAGLGAQSRGASHVSLRSAVRAQGGLWAFWSCGRGKQDSRLLSLPSEAPLPPESLTSHAFGLTPPCWVPPGLPVEGFPPPIPTLSPAGHPASLSSHSGQASPEPAAQRARG